MEIPSEVSMSSLRDLKKLGESFKKLSELRAVDGTVPKLRSRKIHFKFATLHDTLRIVDVNLFPNFIHAHAEGVKCAVFSSFDSNLWLTGGYDCVIRIRYRF
jgi:WD40 repeat protein